MKQLLSISRYNSHKYSALKRGIPFELTYEEWYSWWLSVGVDKNLPPVKKSKDTLCMCRVGDSGPYSLNNIYCDTLSNNSKAINKYSQTFARKAVRTPQGVFDSLTEAAEFHNCSVQDMSQRVRKVQGYEFVNRNHYSKGIDRKSK